MRNAQRLQRLEQHVAQLTGRTQAAALLHQQQDRQHARVCQVLGCAPSAIPFLAYAPQCWESSVVTLWISQAAPAWALRQWAQEACPVLLPALERFLQHTRYEDPLWTLQHGFLVMGSPYAYRHFLATFSEACEQVWPAEEEPPEERLLQWLAYNTPDAYAWTEATSLAVQYDALAATLTRLHEEYAQAVLKACYSWRPRQTYPYQGNPTHGGQPSGWGIEGRPLGMGVYAPPVESTATAWQYACARQLVQRWTEQMQRQAEAGDAAAWDSGQESPDC
jgi:hypothetical protein